MAGNYRRNFNNYKKKAEVVPGSQYRPVANPSPEQQAIFTALLESSDNLMVDAKAGCGKTTTCVEGQYRVLKQNPKASQVYLIFAKRNQQEAIGKCPPSVVCKTAHAFGLQALAVKFGKMNVDKQKNERIATQLVGSDDEKSDLRFMLGKGLDLAKDYLATNTEEIEAIVDKHGLDTFGMEPSAFAEKVLHGMELSAKETNAVSFSDMTWLPIKLGCRIPNFDYVYPDECQDLNKARQELVFRALGPRSRLMAVGDPAQAIFGFTGSDRFALANMITRSNARMLPLHLTFRCAKSIVEQAKQFVPEYQAAPSNPEGEVLNKTEREMMADDGVAAGDFILSRTNAPLMGHALRLLIDGRRCNIQGKDLGVNLLGMIKRSKAKDVSSFLDWLQNWADTEVERLSAKKRSFEHITDKKECFEVLCEGRRSLDEIKGYIRDLFDDKDEDENRIILSTIHKSKGLERNRVWLLNKSFVVKPKTDEEIEAERNIRYVGITRAKNSLFFVE